MRFDLSKLRTKEQWQQLGHVLMNRIRYLPRLILIRQARAIEFILLFVVAGVALYLMIVLFVLEPKLSSDSISDKPVLLQVEEVDRLEFWIEVRQAEQDRELRLSPRDFTEAPKVGGRR